MSNFTAFLTTLASGKNAQASGLLATLNAKEDTDATASGYKFANLLALTKDNQKQKQPIVKADPVVALSTSKTAKTATQNKLDSATLSIAQNVLKQMRSAVSALQLQLARQGKQGASTTQSSAASEKTITANTTSTNTTGGTADTPTSTEDAAEATVDTSASSSQDDLSAILETLQQLMQWLRQNIPQNNPEPATLANTDTATSPVDSELSATDSQIAANSDTSMYTQLASIADQLKLMTVVLEKVLPHDSTSALSAATLSGTRQASRDVLEIDDATQSYSGTSLSANGTTESLSSNTATPTDSLADVSLASIKDALNRMSEVLHASGNAQQTKQPASGSTAPTPNTITQSTTSVVIGHGIKNPATPDYDADETNKKKDPADSTAAAYTPKTPIALQHSGLPQNTTQNSVVNDATVAENSRKPIPLPSEIIPTTKDTTVIATTASAAKNKEALPTTNPALTGATADGLRSATTYSFTSQLTAARTAATASAVDQVALRLRRGAKMGESEMSLQLHPADLGSINVKLSFSAEGKVQGTVTADQQSTLDLLLKDARSLERALQDAGLRTDPGSLQFNLSQQQGNSANSYNQTKNNPSAQTASLAPALGATTDTTDILENWVISPNRVNLKV